MEIAQVKENSKTTQTISLSWSDNASVQKLLDVLVSIIAKEPVSQFLKNTITILESLSFYHNIVTSPLYG